MTTLSLVNWCSTRIKHDVNYLLLEFFIYLFYFSIFKNYIKKNTLKKCNSIHLLLIYFLFFFHFFICSYIYDHLIN